MNIKRIFIVIFAFSLLCVPCPKAQAIDWGNIGRGLLEWHVPSDRVVQEQVIREKRVEMMRERANLTLNLCKLTYALGRGFVHTYPRLALSSGLITGAAAIGYAIGRFS